MKCQKCAKCCFDVDLTITDYERIKKQVPNLDDYIAHTDFTTFRIDGPCPFLKNKRCTIYKIRPMICRAYPVIPAVPSVNGMFVSDGKMFHFVLDPKCPAHKTLKKHEIRRAKMITRASFKHHMNWCESKLTKEDMKDAFEKAIEDMKIHGQTGGEEV
jgi:Fe-S-cluster containining protein